MSLRDELTDLAGQLRSSRHASWTADEWGAFVRQWEAFVEQQLAGVFPEERAATLEKWQQAGEEFLAHRRTGRPMNLAMLTDENLRAIVAWGSSAAEEGA